METTNQWGPGRYGGATGADAKGNLCCDHPLRCHALVVEDEPTSRTIIRFLLEQLGLSVETAVNGQQALEKIRTGSFDVVFMDVQMPVMDGVTATKILRTDPGYASVSSVRIIALTACNGQGDRERLLGEGMDDYLAKPVRRNMLVRAIFG